MDLRSELFLCKDLASNMPGAEECGFHCQFAKDEASQDDLQDAPTGGCVCSCCDWPWIECLLALQALGCSVLGLIIHSRKVNGQIF